MSQSLLTTALTLIIAAILTPTIAIATSTARTSRCAVKVTLIGAAIAFAAVALQRANVRINFTGSMPIGIYLLSPLPRDGVKRGMFVAACAPARAKEIGVRRGYLARGPCANGTELLLKSVAAVTHDVARVTAAGISVNGCLLPQSQPVPRDAGGRALVSWPQGRDRMVPGQLWLYAGDRRSWDSRYWGPASVDEIEGEALPLLVLTGLPVYPTRRQCPIQR